MSVWLALVIVGVGLTVLWWYLRRKDYEQVFREDLDRVGLPAHIAKWKYEYTRPGGGKVRSTVYVPVVALQDVTDGINEQIIRYNAVYPEWVNYTDAADYDVLFVDPNAETIDGKPALLVSGGLGRGRIKTAGTVIGVQPYSILPRPYIVLPHQEKSGWVYRDYLKHAAWFESEHVREWMNDRTVFYSFATVGDVHPHVAEPGE